MRRGLDHAMTSERSDSEPLQSMHSMIDDVSHFNTVLVQGILWAVTKYQQGDTSTLCVREREAGQRSGTLGVVRGVLEKKAVSVMLR